MKALSTSIYTLFFVLVFSAANAQLSASSEPRGVVTESGEIIILPLQFTEEEEKAEVTKAPAKQVYRNVAQKRAGLGKMRNGYFKMEGSNDWGTSMRLNSYGYVTTVTRAAKPVLAEAAPAMESNLAQVAETAKTELPAEAHFIAPGILQRVALK